MKWSVADLVIRDLVASSVPMDGEQYFRFHLEAMRYHEQSAQTFKEELAEEVHTHPVGAWIAGIHGLDKMHAVELLGEIDIEHLPTAGSLWTHAGLIRSAKSYNAKLQKVFNTINNIFYRDRKHPESPYGRVISVFVRFSNDRYPDAPPQIIARWARNFTIKLFASHLHHVMYYRHFGCLPPYPEPLMDERHTHFIPPPHLPEWCEAEPINTDWKGDFLSKHVYRACHPQLEGDEE